jgi:IS1 family transposase
VKLNLTPLEIFLMLQLGLWVYLHAHYWKRVRRGWREWRRQRRGPRQLRPRDPSACPRCVQDIGWLERKPYGEVVPWGEVKQGMGRPKVVDSSGYACLNGRCEYYGITDARIHALVSDGQRGGVQYWRCQACGGRRTSRLATSMYQLKTPLERVALVLAALAEGLDQAAATRLFGHHPSTIQRWLDRSGQHGERLQARVLFRALAVGHVQLDELVTRVKHEAERVWVWTAIAAQSKLIFAVHVGGRTTEDACELIHQVWERLKEGCFPVYTSDGLNQYFYALTAHFGQWTKPPRARKWHWVPDARLQYGQVRKQRSGQRVRFLSSIIRLGTRPVIRTTLQRLGFTGRIQTAYVERSNLTLRELIAPLSRRTWSLANDRKHLWLHLQWGLTYYHFVRPHQSLEVRVRGPSRRRYRTPAMVAGLTSKRWTVAEVLLLPVPALGQVAPLPVV